MTEKKYEKSYVLYANEKYFDVVSGCVNSIRTFSNLPIIVYLLDSDRKVDIENVIPHTILTMKITLQR